MKYLLMLTLLVGCGKPGNESKLPCEGSQLVGTWYLDHIDQKVKFKSDCSFILETSGIPENGYFIDNNKGSKRGMAILTYDNGSRGNLGYEIIYKIGGGKSIYYIYEDLKGL